MKDYNNKVVWIIGVFFGIGEVFVYVFVGVGVSVVILVCNCEVLECVKVVCLCLDEVFIVFLDVVDFDVVFGVVKVVIDYFGYINVFINNVGIF